MRATNPSRSKSKKLIKEIPPKENSPPPNKLVSIIKTFFRTFNCSSLPIMSQTVVCILMILLTNCLFTNATLTPNTGIQFNQGNHQKGLLPHLNGGGEANKTFSTYETDHIAIQTFEIRLENMIDNLFNKLEANCATITLWNNMEQYVKMIRLAIIWQKRKFKHPNPQYLHYPSPYYP